MPAFMQFYVSCNLQTQEVTQRRQRLIENCLTTGMKSKTCAIRANSRLVWTADARPHPAVTRTLQYVADIASSRNGQHLSARSLQHRWKTRDPDRSSTPESSHDMGSSAEPFGSSAMASRWYSLIEL